MPDPPLPYPLLLPPREAAKLLGICERTLWTITKSGEIPHVRMRRCVRYDVQDIRAWIDANKKGVVPDEYNPE